MFEWKKYNGAMVSAEPPYISPTTEDVKRALNEKNSLFVRYTSDFDCGHPTEWWYLIKDREFDIDEVKAKRRYEIKKGLKNTDVRRVSFDEYAEKIHNVMVKAVRRYSGGGSASPVNAIRAKSKDSRRACIAAFIKDTDIMIGYAALIEHSDYLDMAELKLDPDYLSLNASAAIVYNVLEEYMSRENIGFVCDGERCIRHKTNFQDYLEKYFGFRKAYCRLHIEYRQPLKTAVKIVYPFRNILKRFRGIGAVNNACAILHMEEICREETE